MPLRPTLELINAARAQGAGIGAFNVLHLESAEALEEGLAGFDGTVLAVTHDRWFARDFDRFLVFGGDGEVRESAEPVWAAERVRRAR